MQMPTTCAGVLQLSGRQLAMPGTEITVRTRDEQGMYDGRRRKPNSQGIDACQRRLIGKMM